MIVAVRDLAAGYGSSTVLQDVALDLPAGVVTCLLGRNGAGKTTLAKTVMGLIDVRAGAIEIAGATPPRRGSHHVARQGIGYAPQEGGVFRELSVRDNLLITCRGRRVPIRAIEAAIAPFPVLEQRLGQKAGSLSGGEQKMLMLARALLGPPALVILDEISEGVQPNVLETFAQVVRDAVQEHAVAFLVIEQHVGFALSVASRFAVMSSGKIVDAGETGEGTRAGVERHLVL